MTEETTKVTYSARAIGHMITDNMILESVMLGSQAMGYFPIHRKDGLIIYEHHPKTWRISRPFTVSATIEERLSYLAGKNANIFILNGLYSSYMNPGDIVEIVDNDDLLVWITGEIIFIKKIKFGNISEWDLKDSVVYKYFNGKINVKEYLSTIYGDLPDKNLIINIVRLHITHAESPTYVLK